MKKNRGDPEFEKRFQKVNVEFDRFEKSLDKEVNKTERWVIERRRFFIKLGITVLLVLILFLISHLFLRVPGTGF